MTKTDKLIQEYEKYCNEIVKEFCKKQELDFEGWVRDEIGSSACCNDISFNMYDIVWDLNSKQPKGEIINWYYDNLESSEKFINYFSYTKGLRINQK